MGERAYTAWELRAAFAAASSGIGLPLPRRLLADAIVRNSRDEHRYAVITACSAVEVALSESAAAALTDAGRSKREVEDILNGVSGAVELYWLNAGRDGGLPVSIGRVMSQLAGPRNRAVHAGETPVADTARDAIRTAKALIEVSPLPRPQSLYRLALQQNQS
jgi:hypothetical protein